MSDYSTTDLTSDLRTLFPSLLGDPGGSVGIDAGGSGGTDEEAAAPSGVGDGDGTPVNRAEMPVRKLADAVHAAGDSVIRSVSGWRSVFAHDGEEESHTADVPEAKLLLVTLAVSLFAELAAGMEKLPADDGPTEFLLARDTRPTGTQLCSAAAGALLARGAGVRYLGVAAAPELFAYARQEQLPFVYITASHNPIGHNGIKFGRDGAVLDREASLELIRSFNALVADVLGLENRFVTLAQTLQTIGPPDLAALVGGAGRFKPSAAQAYKQLTSGIAFGHPDTGEEIEFLSGELRSQIGQGGNLTIVADHNGGARTQSIDEVYLSELGLDYHPLNNRPGSVVHKIEPEGEALDECLSALRGAGEGIGYVSDNDGDRGNLVITDGSREPRILPAQSVFALVCAAELLWVRCLIEAGIVEQKPLAVVANGPTSLRVDEICRTLGAELHRAEVGEANVLGKAAALRGEGYRVRIVGEGSNGGNITFPGRVRDPLSTVLSVVKLLNASVGDVVLRARFAELFGASSKKPHLAELVDLLPRYSTTPTSEGRAKLRIRSTDHGKLKSAYEHLFPNEFAKRRPLLEDRFGITGYHFVNYEGINTLAGPGGRHGEQRGGMSVVLTDKYGNSRGFLWMRGSGTEPVFRIIADIKAGTDKDESELLEWQASMVRQADSTGESADSNVWTTKTK